MKRIFSVLACVALIFSLSAGLCMAAEGDKEPTKKEEPAPQGGDQKQQPAGASNKTKKNDLDS